MRRFTVYRRGDLSATHNANQVNAPSAPQFEGVVFTDGSCCVRWLTAMRSTSVWANFNDMWAVHGHAEDRYATEIVWHDRAFATPTLPIEQHADAKEGKGAE